MKVLLTIATALFLTACAVQPKPTTANEFRCNAEGCRNVTVPYDPAKHDGEVGECEDDERAAGQC